MAEDNETVTPREEPGLDGDVEVIASDVHRLLDLYGHQGAFRAVASPRVSGACSYREAECGLLLLLTVLRPLCWINSDGLELEWVLAEALARLRRRRMPFAGEWRDFSAMGPDGPDDRCTPFQEWYRLLAEEHWQRGDRARANLYDVVGRLASFDGYDVAAGNWMGEREGPR